MKATQRQFLVEVQGIPGLWRSFSGGNITAEANKDYSGGANRPDLLGGPPDTDDIEVVRTFDPAVDQEWIDRIIRDDLVGTGRYTITKIATDANFTKIGNPRTFANSLLTGLTEPDSDASSGDSAEITLTFATAGPA